MRYRNSVWTWRNLAVLPIVVFVRVPILFPLNLIALVGVGAEKASDFLDGFIPGLERVRKPVPLKPGEQEPKICPKPTDV